MPRKKRTKHQLESENVNSQSQHDNRKKTEKKNFWVKVPLEGYKALREYLGHEVQEVIKLSTIRYEQGYAFLVIDGASGVGKTQQAFALLKEHGYLIYVIMSTPEQDIYKNVNWIHGTKLSFNDFHTLCDNAIKVLGENITKEGEDYLSVDFMRQNRGIREMLLLRDHLMNTELRYRKDKGKFYRKVGYNNKLDEMTVGEKYSLSTRPCQHTVLMILVFND